MASSPNQILQIYLILDGVEKQISTEGKKLINFGRADECDVVIDVPKASRVHAEIRIESDKYRIIDKRSANGTLLNGEPVDSAVLRAGDRIQIGAAVIEIRSAGPSPRVQAPGKSSRKGAGKGSGARNSAGSSAAPVDQSAAPESRPPLPRRGRPIVSRVTDGALMVLLLLLLTMIGVEYNKGPRTIRKEADQNQRAEIGTDATINDSIGVATPPDEGEVEQALIEQELAAAEITWDSIEALRAIGRRFPSSKAAKSSAELAAALEGLRFASDLEKRQSLDQVLGSLILDDRLGEANSIARFLAGVDGSEVDQGYWRARAEAISDLAHTRLKSIQEQVTALLDQNQPGEALRIIAMARSRLGGVPEYELALGELVEGVADVRWRQRGRLDQPPQEWASLLSMARRLQAECRYLELPPVLHRAIALDLPSNDHIEALEMLVKAGALATMFNEFLEGASGGDLQVELASGSTRVYQATRDRLTLEREISGGKMVDQRQWSQVNSSERSVLFRAVPHSLEGVMGMVYLAEISGDDDGFHRALVNLHRRTRGTELAEAILQRSRGGVPVTGGFEEYEGRLVTTLEKEQIIENRRLRKEREREAIAQAKRLKKSNKIEVIIEYVQILREEGSFSLADRMLREVVAESDDAEQSSEARELLENPYLAEVSLREGGKPSNRIDLFILGDGYLVEDQQQESFLNHARTCEKLLFSVDPYREYEQYFNVTAVHLQSKDQGISREPGEIVKDTALGCKVRYDVLTSNGSKVFDLLSRLGDAGKDRQSIVIANDTAGVATGGGGVTSLPKGALGLVNHEVGHSLGGLHDEYDYEPGQDPDKQPPPGRDDVVATREAPPNLMHGSDKSEVEARVIWRRWIEAEDRWWNGSKVGLFEGGDRKPFHVWRPQVSCMMRDNSGFCVVCMEHMVKVIYSRVRPIDRVEPEPGDLVLQKSEDEEVILKVWTLQPRTHDLEVQWLVLSYGLQRPVPVGETSSGDTAVVDQRPGERWRRAQSGVDPTGKMVQAAQIRAKDLEPGWHRVRCQVKDPTRWVLRDDEGLLQQQLEWWVEVRP
ncbi:MAG: M64 family metallo-endopeptidase [Planctomycetota bacterium]|nr:M64 family metallo-endopeptidase [Planctomycetota bacterium]